MLGLTKTLGAAVLVLLLVTGAGLVRAAEEYVLGPEDVISINVWESPNLSRTVVVRAGGTVTFPPLGDIPAAGKTSTVLARDLEREIYNSLRKTSQVTITVVVYNSQKVFVSGQVAVQGRHSFEELPDLMGLLAEVGGLSPTADLSNVRIVRTEGELKRTINVDLSSAVASGNLAGLPRLQTNDLIIVPANAAAATAGAIGGGVGTGTIYVMGAVGRQGPIGAATGLTLFQALSLAGGLALNADLRAVEVISSDPAGGSYLMRVNLEQEILSGNPGPIIRPGDSIRVRPRDLRGMELATSVLRGTLETSRDLLNLILIRDIVVGDSNRRSAGRAR